MSEPATKTLRQQIRDALALAKAKIVEVDFHGQKIEVHQPSVGFVLNREGRTDIVTILMYFAYVPGTGEKLFEESDREWLEKLPYDDEFDKLTTRVNQELLQVAADDAAKNLPKAPGDIKS